MGITNSSNGVGQPSTAELIAKGQQGITWDGFQWHYPNGATSGGAASQQSAPGTLNIPYGADYLDPQLRFLLGVLGIDATGKQQSAAAAAEAERQKRALQAAEYDTTTGRLLSASQILAAMQTNPRSAAQLAFQRSGLGLDPFGDNALDAAKLATFSTRGNTGTDGVDFGGGAVANVARALNLKQLKGLSGDPNGQGVLESFAGAAGNPDIIRRSIAALIPTGFGGVGAG